MSGGHWYRGRRAVVSRTDPRGCNISLTLAALFRFVRTVDRPQRPHTIQDNGRQMTTNPPQIVFDHILAFEVSKEQLLAIRCQMTSSGQSITSRKLYAV